MFDHSTISPLPRASIRAVSVAFPENVLTNDELLAGVPEHVSELLIRHTGVRRRHIARPEETALDLGEQACMKLFAEHPQLRELVDVLIFCTQSPDYVLPPNSCVLHGRLGEWEIQPRRRHAPARRPRQALLRHRAHWRV